MNLRQTIEIRKQVYCAAGIHAGGPGSGCQGENCGRPSGSGNKDSGSTDRGAGNIAHKELAQKYGLKLQDNEKTARATGVWNYKGANEHVVVNDKTGRWEAMRQGEVHKGNDEASLQQFLTNDRFPPAVDKEPGGGKASKWDSHAPYNKDMTPQQESDARAFKNDAVNKLASWGDMIQQALVDDDADEALTKQSAKAAYKLRDDVREFKKAIETDSRPDPARLRMNMGKISDAVDELRMKTGVEGSHLELQLLNIQRKMGDFI